MEVFKSFLITSELVTKFAILSGDKNPIHIDAEYAKQTVFGKPIAHGMLLSSFFSSIIAEDYPGPGSIYLKQDLSFLKPCFIGEKVKVVVTLIKQEGNKYFLSTKIYNAHNELAIEGNALVLKK